MQHVRYLIIGAGPTGLGAAHRLEELGVRDVLVLEEAAHYGGLAASFVDEHGFTWDIGGHVQFSHYRYFDDLMIRALGEDGWLHHQRESWVWIADRFVPYPFQNNIRHLPKEMMWRCLSGIIDAARDGAGRTPENFEEWILATFGPGVAEAFMLPYNFKVWAYPARRLAHQWIGDRVAVTDPKRVLENVLFERDDVSWGPNNTFRYPKRGGTGSVWCAVADVVGRERIRLGARVARIVPARRVVQLADGEELRYDALLSTVPLDLLAGMVVGLPDGPGRAARELLHSSSHIVGVGLAGEPPETLRTKCWTYFPEATSPFYRVTVFSNYSPHNTPDGARYWSLMTETSESPSKPVNRARLVEDTIRGLIDTKLIPSRDGVVSTWLYTAEHGYPTPSLERDAILARVQPALEGLGVHSRGRFGGWKYEVSNQDHSLMQGVEWANRMERGVPEVTYPYPGVANATYAE